MDMRRGTLLFLFLLFGNAWASPGNHPLQACQQECPTWFDRNGSMTCTCGELLDGTVLCDQNSNSSALHFEFCMTYNGLDNSTVVVSCPYINHRPNESLYVKLPQDVCDLNEFMCGGLNRTGLLCSDCEAGLGPAVFSYTLPCLNCLDSRYGWLLYMFLATFPTTVMFLVIIFCQMRITAAPMNAFIFICQAVSSLINTNPHMYTEISNFLLSLFLTIYGIWNLDFFRFIIPPFCISSTMTTIQAMTLEYIVAFYPLVLIVVSYACIQLHARGCWVLVHLWRPFQRCCACNWNPLHSLVHAFAAFLLLSYSKILFVSFNLLHYGRIQDNHGNNVGPFIMYYNASVPYFGSDHLPFALLAIFILVTFSVLPVLILLLYPTRVFQRCIGCCSTRWHALDTFVDAFQGYYKDGTDGTPDWRYFSGLYLIFRIMAIATHVLPATHYTVVYRVTCYSSASLLFGLLRPYKEIWINVVDSIGFMLFSLAEFIAVYNEHVDKSYSDFLLYCLGTVPLIYISCYILYNLLSRLGLLHCCGPFCKSPTIEDHVWESYRDGEEYESLLPNTLNPSRSSVTQNQLQFI